MILMIVVFQIVFPMLNDNETYFDHFSHLSVAMQYIFNFLRS